MIAVGELAVIFVVLHRSASSSAVRIVSGVHDLVLAPDLLGEEAVLFGQMGRDFERLAAVARELAVEVVQRVDADGPVVTSHAFTSFGEWVCASSRGFVAPPQTGSVVQRPVAAS